jgi:hypothetical protein
MAYYPTLKQLALRRLLEPKQGALIRVVNNTSRTPHLQRHVQSVQHDRHVQRGGH